MEEGRHVYGRHTPTQRIERGQTTQIWRRAYRRVGGREGRYDFEVFRVKDVALDERYRVRLRRCFEEFVPEVRKFCKCPR